MMIWPCVMDVHCVAIGKRTGENDIKEKEDKLQYLQEHAHRTSTAKIRAIREIR